MGTVNRVILVGSVGAMPDIRRKTNGATVATFSLATARTDELGHKDWHRIVAEGSLAHDVEEEVSRGDRLYIEGRIKYGTYERDGTVIPTTDVVADELVILDREAQ